jgi:hypothetical protein
VFRDRNAKGQGVPFSHTAGISNMTRISLFLKPVGRSPERSLFLGNLQRSAAKGRAGEIFANRRARSRRLPVGVRFFLNTGSFPAHETLLSRERFTPFHEWKASSAARYPASSRSLATKAGAAGSCQGNFNLTSVVELGRVAATPLSSSSTKC